MTEPTILYVARAVNIEQIKELNKIEESLRSEGYNVLLLPQIAVTGNPEQKTGFFDSKNIENFVGYIKGRIKEILKETKIDTLHFHGKGHTKEGLEDLVKEQIEIIKQIRDELKEGPNGVSIETILNLHVESFLPFGNYWITTNYSKGEFEKKAKEAKEKTEEIIEYARENGVEVLLEAAGHVNFAMAKNREEQKQFWREWSLDIRQKPWLWIPMITQEGDFLGTRESQEYFGFPITLDLGHIVKTILYSRIFNIENAGKKLQELSDEEREALKYLGLVEKDNNGAYKLMFDDEDIIVPKVEEKDYSEKFGFYIKRGSPIVFKKELSFKDFMSEFVTLFHIHSETGAAGYYWMVNKEGRAEEVRFIPSHAPFITYLLKNEWLDFESDPSYLWIPNIESAKEHAQKQEYWLEKTMGELGEKIKNWNKDIVLEGNVPASKKDLESDWYNKERGGPVYSGETYRFFMRKTIEEILNKLK